MANKTTIDIKSSTLSDHPDEGQEKVFDKKFTPANDQLKTAIQKFEAGLLFFIYFLFIFYLFFIYFFIYFLLIFINFIYLFIKIILLYFILFYFILFY